MRKLLRAIASTILWSYERGSWPYDLMVAVIVVFVLVTPRRWFHDQPQTTTSNPGIIIESDDPSSHIEILRLNPSVLGQPQRGKSTAQLEQKTHQILSSSVEEFKTQRFQVQSIQPVRGSDGALLYYEVQIKH